LVDLGVESFLITATVEAIVAQRLVRRICTQCKEEYKPSTEELLELKLHQEDVADRTFYRGKGCSSCNNSGYRGRLALFEIMEFDDSLRELILSQASTAVLRVEAQKRGMRSLRESGLLSIFDGQTTIDEVVRETMLDE
jgi:type IV pilus assembly protein PilB